MRQVAALGWWMMWALAPAGAQTDVASAFQGTWVVDQSRTERAQRVALQFRRAGSGLEEVRGEQGRPVVFDGVPHALPGSATTVAWRQVGPGRFERARFLEGVRKDQTRVLEISEDGSLLTEVIENRRSDGEVVRLNSLMRRAGGGGGRDLAGDWVLVESPAGGAEAFTWTVAGDLVRQVTEGRKTYFFPLDGSFVPLIMPGAFQEMTAAMRPLADGALERITKFGGTPFRREVFRVAADGKSLRVEATELGPNATAEAVDVLVYRRK